MRIVGIVFLLACGCPGPQGGVDAGEADSGATRLQTVYKVEEQYWSIWGASPNDVWAGGTGKIAHWNGSNWHVSPVTGTFQGKVTAAFVWVIWGTDADTAWLADTEPLLNFRQLDGGSFSSWPGEPTGRATQVYGLWGASKADVWAIGADLEARPDTLAYHFDGSSWVRVPITTDAGAYLQDVWGSGANDVWAVGGLGQIVRWDGRQWKQVESGTHGRINGIWGSSADDIWAVGEGGAIFRWRGMSWQAVDAGVTADLSGISGSSPSDVWAVGALGSTLHFNGETWSSMDAGTGESLYRVAAVGSRDVWAVGHKVIVRLR